MSGRIVGEVLDHAPGDLRPGDLLVLIALAEDAHDKDRTARGKASADAIAYRVRSTPSSVRNALQRLKQRSLIRPVHDRVHRGQAQHWTITKLSDYHREGARSWPDEPQHGSASTAPADPDPSHTVPRTGTPTGDADAQNVGLRIVST